MAVLVNAFSNALKISLEEGRRIFERIQDVFARECVQECRKWCPKSCPMEFPGRLKLSILHGPHGGHGGPEPMQPQRITCGCIGCGRQMIPKRAQRRPKGWQKGVRGRGSPACLFQFGREISIKIERCVFSILWNIDYFVCFMSKSETRVFTFVFVKQMMFFDLLKSILFCGREQHWNRMRPAHFWKERSNYMFLAGMLLPKYRKAQ